MLSIKSTHVHISLLCFFSNFDITRKCADRVVSCLKNINHENFPLLPTLCSLKIMPSVLFGVLFMKGRKIFDLCLYSNFSKNYKQYFIVTERGRVMVLIFCLNELIMPNIDLLNANSFNFRYVFCHSASP